MHSSSGFFIFLNIVYYIFIDDDSNKIRSRLVPLLPCERLDRCESSSTTATTHNNNNHQSSSHCFVGRKGFLQFVQTVLGISILHDDQNEYDKDEYDEQQQQHWIKIQCMEQALIQRLIQGILQ